VTDPRDRVLFEKILFEAMSGSEYDFVKAFSRRSRPRPFYDASELPTKVSIDQRASQTHTLLDIQTMDQPGLLYRIAVAIAECGLTVTSARVLTEKGAALDTFYLCDADGRKIGSEKVLADLAARVRQGLAAT
jgi:[protein-PII] uridylyltransferase